ncbi:hypothetical protein [Gymnodinialimonas hymeniacidonis]|uniref:hypothetical protein n=1 Tax=Gymnodinialimonas hymeniacidonis TaxID=3126508 RepID=UPI0034C66050
MHLSFNAIITLCLVLYVIWMAYSENAKEKASEAKLSPDQLKRFNDAYTFAQPAQEYPNDLQDHAAIAQRARIRKVVSAVILGAVVLFVLLRGL